MRPCGVTLQRSCMSARPMLDSSVPREVRSGHAFGLPLHTAARRQSTWVFSSAAHGMSRRVGSDCATTTHCRWKAAAPPCLLGRWNRYMASASASGTPTDTNQGRPAVPQLLQIWLRGTYMQNTKPQTCPACCKLSPRPQLAAESIVVSNIQKLQRVSLALPDKWKVRQETISVLPSTGR